MEVNSIVDAIKKSLREKREIEWNKVFVTDVSVCLRLSYYRRIHGNSIVPNMLVGEDAHSRILPRVAEELGAKYEVSVARQIDNVVLYGRIDLLLDDGTPIELKLSNIILQHHILQAEYYAYMVGSSKFVVCVVTDMANVICKEFAREKEDRWLEQRVKRFAESLGNRVEPEPEKSYMCRWCEYRGICLGHRKLVEYIV